MGPAIAQPHHRMLARHHLAAGIEVEMGIVGEGREQEGFAFVFEHVIVGNSFGRTALTGGNAGDRSPL